ncbi:hypothetical protein GGS23DRAFT_184473 [Durotheca rogersii]|uniref:uncharacterized protein n=1 Tax=Durotheca rogersii TaxID=419775 RepID=UPI00221F90F4|nr:uncharacterized protein GGS23DRAFT_184473 [Durotheca rogersii]KAI5867582.1 hypothetical protein GGS23DRAFT_184473 [Durotheca rogersii]
MYACAHLSHCTSYWAAQLFSDPSSFPFLPSSPLLPRSSPPEGCLRDTRLSRLSRLSVYSCRALPRIARRPWPNRRSATQHSHCPYPSCCVHSLIISFFFPSHPSLSPYTCRGSLATIIPPTVAASPTFDRLFRSAPRLFPLSPRPGLRPSRSLPFRYPL